MPKPCAEKKMATSGDNSDFPSSIVVLVAIVEENKFFWQPVMLKTMPA